MAAPKKEIKKKAAPKKKSRAKITAEDLPNVERLYRAGFTDEQIASVYRCARNTLTKYKRRHEITSEMLREWKDFEDDNVEQSLLIRAKGFFTTRQEVEVYEGEVLKEKRITKTEHPPDTKAALSWLKNRRPKEWAESFKIDFNGQINSMTDEELDERLKELLTATGLVDGVETGK
jgi:hypothetical protein